MKTNQPIFSQLWDRAHAIATEAHPMPHANGFYNPKVHTIDHQQRVARWVEIVKHGIPNEPTCINQYGVNMAAPALFFKNLDAEILSHAYLAEVCEGVGIPHARRPEKTLRAELRALALKNWKG